MTQNGEARLETSHLILHCGDTDASIDFWCKGLGGELEQDEELSSPALDAIFGREGVRIRDTFIRVGGVRIHTIETLDQKRTRAELGAFEKPAASTVAFVANSAPEAFRHCTQWHRARSENGPRAE